MRQTAPITFREVDLAEDYNKLCAWWSRHGSPAVPDIVLKRGYFAMAGPIEVACAFLHVDPRGLAAIEWMTTNPACALSADLIAGVKGLYAHLEDEARKFDCNVCVSFVKPNSGEERLMAKCGYVTSMDEPPHRTYYKPLAAVENYTPPVDGILRA